MSISKFCVPFFSQPLVMLGGNSSTKIGINNPMLCDTGYAITVDGSFYCMKAPKSITSYKVPVTVGTECFYDSYLNVNAPFTPTTQYDLAMCGFNVNSKAYCN